jgi:hypothetical protein
MAAAGYDPAALVEMLRLLESAQKTHPGCLSVKQRLACNRSFTCNYRSARTFTLKTQFSSIRLL